MYIENVEETTRDERKERERKRSDRERDNTRSTPERQ